MTKRRRLESAGYVHVSGWVPAAYAARVAEQIDMHRDDVEKAADVVKPRGRQKKVEPA